MIFHKPFNYKGLSESGPIKFKSTGHYFAKIGPVSIRIWPKVLAYYPTGRWDCEEFGGTPAESAIQ